MCSLAVSILNSPAVDPRSNPSSGEILMSENLKLCTTAPDVSCLIDIAENVRYPMHKYNIVNIGCSKIVLW